VVLQHLPFARELLLLLLLSEFKAVLHQAFVPLLLMMMGFLLDRLRWTKEEEEEDDDDGDDDGYRPHCPYVANPGPGSTSSITLLLLLQHLLLFSHTWQQLWIWIVYAYLDLLFLHMGRRITVERTLLLLLIWSSLELLPLVTFGGPANIEEIILGFLLFCVGCGGAEETIACGLAVSLHMVLSLLLFSSVDLWRNMDLILVFLLGFHVWIVEQQILNACVLAVCVHSCWAFAFGCGLGNSSKQQKF
jgi:hypothetical protein